MDKKEEEFLNKLLSMFKTEAKEHLSAITEGLIELEKSPPEKQTGLIETIFREAHSLKGAARTVNLKDIESLCQSMENVFASLKRKEIAATPHLFDELHHAADYAGKLIFGEAEPDISENAKIKEIIQNLQSAVKGEAPQPQIVSSPPLTEEKPGTPPATPETNKVLKPQTSRTEDKPRSIETMQPSSSAETVRISTTKLDSLLFQAEEMLSVKLAAGQRTLELQEIEVSFAAWKKEWAKVQPEVRSLVRTEDAHTCVSSKLVDFLEMNEAFIKSLDNRLMALTKNAEYDNRQFGGMVDSLLDDMKKVLMLPFSSLSAIFPKLVRDLSHDQGKDVELVAEGEEIEIDRRILEEMKDPLIHLLRNCIDHGIEKPDERQQKHKPPRGTLKLAMSAKEGGKIEIIVSDDGAGIEASRIKSAAVKRGVISQEEAGKLGEQDALSLIFLSGVSTSPIITEVSGRGLGLAIVREKVEKLNGIVSFETQSDRGTTFRIVVPLTLATFRGLLVQTNGSLFVLPATNAERALRIRKEEIKTVENRQTISINGQIVSLVRLADVLELPEKTRSIPDENVQIVVIGFAEKRIAFMVDEVLHEQEVLVKSLGRQLLRVRNVSGATVLGSGRVAPILNVNDLIKSAVKVTATPVKAQSGIEAKAKRNSLLVVEDSITARTLLKNILETAGYNVITAIDGVDAFTALKTREFDLVVSDVDMPRMNGFDLTVKIRADKKLSRMPVVLVTALESRESKERGIEVGANAYIVKSSFDQSNLLEVIRRLI
ncbi:MAG: hybrid sensor histidine kinase/response regulator [Candidatus Methanoperedens sp.]|nr:hybrid sensor histidine kinase/response regulator [Candidatus Methanoperedens sp.]